MAINDVSLTSGMRANLLSLQGTVDLLNRTQNRLSSGKKVNSAIDNPVSFFASQALTSRASVIDSLKDAMGQAVQTITAADKGIKAITAMIEQAKGIAQAALSAEPGAAPADATVDAADQAAFIAGTVEIDVAAMTVFTAGTVEIDVDDMASRVGSKVTLELGTMADDETITIGAGTFTKKAAGPGANEFTNAAELAALIDALGTHAASENGGVVTISMEDNSDIVIGDIGGTGAAKLTLANVAAVDGDTIEIDGTTYMKGRATDGFADAAALDALLEAAGYVAGTAGEVISVSKAGETVTVAEFNAIAGVTVDTAEEAGDTIEIDGTTYMKGRATDGFANAAALDALLEAADYAAGTAAEVISVSKAEATVTVDEFNASAGVTVDVEEEEATTVTFDGTEYVAGEDFEIGANAQATAQNLADVIKAADDTIATATANAAGSITVTYTPQPSDELVSLTDQYNTLRTQLTELAEDSGYKGKNLLSTDTLVVKFEGTNLSVVGFNASAEGLGIDGATWTEGNAENQINAAVTALDEALVTLRSESSKLSGNLSIITVRQEFSTNMINTLTEGSDKLTLADANEEGANMLMLQTRQTLSTTALSMSAQAAQSVLRLFQ